MESFFLFSSVCSTPFPLQRIEQYTRLCRSKNTNPQNLHSCLFIWVSISENGSDEQPLPYLHTRQPIHDRRLPRRGIHARLCPEAAIIAVLPTPLARGNRDEERLTTEGEREAEATLCPAIGAEDGINLIHHTS